MKKQIILFLLIFSCFKSQAQNLSVADLQSIYKLANWEAVDTYLNNKGWRFEGSEKKADGNSTIAWTYKKSSTVDKANGWFYLTLEGAKFAELRYELSDVAKYNLEKSSITQYGYKQHGSAIYNDALVTEYRNTSFQVLFIITKESNSYTDVTIRSIFMERLQSSLPVVQSTPNNKSITTTADTIKLIPFSSVYFPPEVVVKDIEGNSYKTIKIGNQEWMAENLNVSKYNDGSSIPIVTDATIWSNLSKPGMCWYNNDREKYSLWEYGALYNFQTVNTGKLCPIGWHIPSNIEWDLLANNLGGAYVAGTKMKSIYNWKEQDSNGINTSDFNAFSVGFRDGQSGSFYLLGSDANWWSSTVGTENIYIRYLSYDSKRLFTSLANKKQGFSVRCIKD